MGETENVTILRVNSKEAVQNVADLRNNVKALKEELTKLEGETDQSEEAWAKYQSTLKQLHQNQQALKDVVHATSGSFDDVVSGVTKATGSYNSLVHQMANLKEEFRSTTDEIRRAELGREINAINTQLKDMDALQGNFQRNVGNYAGGIKDAFKDLASNTDAFGKSLNLAKGGVNGFKDSFEALGKSPAIATFGILVSVAIKLAEALKENDTAMAAVKKAMSALQPVMDFFSGILENVADVLADVITKVSSFVTSNGLFQKVLKGVMGIGNAVVEFIIAPFKGVVAAIRVFKEEGIKGFRNASKAFQDEFKSGLAFRDNFKTGQVAAETLIAGAASRRKKAKETGKDIGKDITEGVIDEVEDIDKEIERIFSDIDKDEEERLKNALGREGRKLEAVEKYYDRQAELNEILTENDEKRAERAYAIEREANEKRLGLLEQFAQDARSRGDLDSYLQYQQDAADLSVEMEMNALKERERLRKENIKKAKVSAKQEIDIIKGVAGATGSILDSIADIYEQNAEGNEKNAKKVKALRIASATIDTLQGAVTAYAAAQSLGVPMGPIVGAINAAAVISTGIAQIAKIKATKVSASASDTDTPSISAAVSAPSLNTEVANVRTITSASEEERLNNMASDQRVYILSSDIEASQNTIKTQVSESSF